VKTLRISLAAILCWFATFANANSLTTDFTDLWFIPAESGWGANVVQQSDILFVTLYVYGPNSQPIWYSASSVVLTGGSGTTFNFSGSLYQTSGPYFGGAFNSGNVTIRPVGTLTFSSTGVNTANISYSVDGVNVFKSVERNTWKSENISGIYLGSSLGNWTGCAQQARNGYVESSAVLTFTHDTSNSTVQIREEGTTTNYTCTYTGNYGQSGRIGSISGTGLCSDGVNATFTATEVVASVQALSMKFNTTQIGGGCTFAGRMGGMRRGQ
jgi:hypothetical protein